jgi:hypothetical protein
MRSMYEEYKMKAELGALVRPSVHFSNRFSYFNKFHLLEVKPQF